MKHFVIVGTQRTGSSALGEGIGLHPEITCGWEWTEHVARGKKLKLAHQAMAGDFSGLYPHHQEHMKKEFGLDTKWLGFRRLFGASNKWLFQPQYSLVLWRDRFEEHIKWFQSQSDIHIIHIIRQDNINWLKSKYVADKAKSFIGQSYPEGLTVKIPIRDAVSRLISKNWIDSRLATLTATNSYIQIIYEDMLTDQNSVTKNALDFLGCDSNLLPEKEQIIRKQSSGGAEKYIENYEELTTELKRLDLLKSKVEFVR